MGSTASPLRKPASPVLQLGEDGEPWVRGFRCDACGAVVAEQTLCCRACASRSAPQPVRLDGKGTLVTWAVVHRSLPGVTVPFVSAIVDLDGGLTLKGTLSGVEPGDLRAGMRVATLFDEAGGALDREGTPYIGFHFVAAGADS